MKNKVKEYFNNKYYNEEKNYSTIISEIKMREGINKNKVLNVVATLLISLIGTTGIVFATAQIYNNYIKEKGEIETEGLFLVKDDLFDGNWHIDKFTDGMLQSKETGLNYKIIKDEEEYSDYKNRVDELPEVSEIDFSNEFLIFMTSFGQANNLHKRDLTISEINADEKTTYVTLAPKENPNYDKTTVTLYAIVDRILLRDDVKFEIDTSAFKIENIISIDKLPENYSKEEAIKDGCMVIERVKEGEFLLDEYKVLSDNKYALDEVIENAEKEIESYVRIYFDDSQEIHIRDVQYKNGIFIITSGRPGNSNIGTGTYKYIIKEHWKNSTYYYGLSNINSSIITNGLIHVTI